jgi:hypothetical protein
MKRLLCALMLAIAIPASTTASLAQGGGAGTTAGPHAGSQDLSQMSVAQLEAAAPRLHPAGLYVLAAKLLGEGRGQDAANWMYAGQLRYRFLLGATEAEGSSDAAILFSALSEQVGRPVNEYIAGDVDEWMAAISWALDWDAANDNSLTSKTEHAAVLTQIRDGLAEFGASLDGRREEIEKTRTENGLPNR